jgi:ribonuclease HI
VIEVWTDGSCSVGSGDSNKVTPGGWAAIVYEDGEEIYSVSGNSPDTTNNRMELLAIIEGITAALTQKGETQICVKTDSQYIANAFSMDWIEAWMRRGWHRGLLIKSGPSKKTGSSTVEHQDLWWVLIYLVKRFGIEIKWVAGKTTPENLAVDALAKAEMAEARKKLKVKPKEPEQLTKGKKKKKERLKKGNISYSTLLEKKTGQKFQRPSFVKPKPWAKPPKYTGKKKR